MIRNKGLCCGWHCSLLSAIQAHLLPSSNRRTTCPLTTHTHTHTHSHTHTVTEDQRRRLPSWGQWFPAPTQLQVVTRLSYRDRKVSGSNVHKSWVTSSKRSYWHCPWAGTQIWGCRQQEKRRKSNDFIPGHQGAQHQSAYVWTGPWERRASLVAQMVKNPLVMQEVGVRPLDQEHPLEEKMATHSSALAWRIPWTEEPGGLQSMREISNLIWATVFFSVFVTAV